MLASSARRDQGDNDHLHEMVPTALEEIEARGHLLNFAPNRPQRLALIKVMAEKGFVVWNRALVKYELTALGYENLAKYQDKIAAGRKSAMQG